MKNIGKYKKKKGGRRKQSPQKGTKLVDRDASSDVGNGSEKGTGKGRGRGGPPAFF